MRISSFSRGRTRSAVLGLLVLVALGASTAQATTVKKMTFSQVIDGAEVIAIGTVTAIQDTWDGELEMPFTQVALGHLEILKGEVEGPALTLRFLGGVAPDGLRLVVAGMPRFAMGDQVAVFSAGNGLRAVSARRLVAGPLPAGLRCRTGWLHRQRRRPDGRAE